jgi:hypothetical protein
MSRLDKARERLEQAVARLERATAKPARGVDRGEIAKALEEARADGAALREASKTVSARLDSVIVRLKSALDA